MKRDRQAVIKQMISRDKIGTQEEIKQRLEAEGITVTQATLSRDLREIGLLKLRDEEGRLYYSLSEHVLPSLDPTVKDYVKSVSRAQFMLVLHTELGEADVLANLIDSDGNPEQWANFPTHSESNLPAHLPPHRHVVSQFFEKALLLVDKPSYVQLDD